jgi:hypothetical protein
MLCDFNSYFNHDNPINISSRFISKEPIFWADNIVNLYMNNPSKEGKSSNNARTKKNVFDYMTRIATK